MLVTVFAQNEELEHQNAVITLRISTSVLFCNFERNQANVSENTIACYSLTLLDSYITI